MIAHRLSTIKQAEQILVLDQGRIVERGNHASLIQAGGIYRQMYQMQSEQLWFIKDKTHFFNKIEEASSLGISLFAWRFFRAVFTNR